MNVRNDQMDDNNFQNSLCITSMKQKLSGPTDEAWRHLRYITFAYGVHWPTMGHTFLTPAISAFYMLNVAHVKNDVKWRPIVTKFGTLIENMSRMRLPDYHIFQILLDDFMRNSNFDIGVLHVKVKYWRIFCDVISLLALVFIVSPNRVS